MLRKNTILGNSDVFHLYTFVQAHYFLTKTQNGKGVHFSTFKDGEKYVFDAKIKFCANDPVFKSVISKNYIKTFYHIHTPLTQPRFNERILYFSPGHTNLEVNWNLIIETLE